MAVTRQDAWTEDEDQFLAEIVLQYIREGGTQLKAFEIVAEKLSRTAAACGFRWNSYLRKKYETDIELAKQERKKFRQQKERKNSEKKMLHYEEAGRSEITIDDVIAFLKSTQHQSVNNQLEEAVVLIRHSTFSSHLFPFRQQAGCQEIYAKRTNLLLIFVKSFA